MPTTTLLLLIVFAAVLSTGFHGRKTGWLWFSLWIVPGFLAAFATISFALGLLVLPFAVAAVLLVARYAKGFEMLGLLPGMSPMCFLVAYIAAGDGRPFASWIVAGSALFFAGVAAYLIARLYGLGPPLSWNGFPRR